MYLIAVPRGFGLLEGVLLQDLDLVIPALTAFKIFKAAV
jgi:hypothetical protein